MSRRFKYFIGFLVALGVLGSLVFIILPAGLFGLYVSGKATPVEIVGTNMEPNYKSGQFWIIDRKHYESNKPQRGDAVVYAVDEGSGEKWRTGRIIGLPGETISISNGNVFINNSEIDELSYKSNNIQTTPGAYLSEDQEITIPEKTFFIMGDNRSNSSDSRETGPIEASRIVGKLTACYKGCN